MNAMLVLLYTVLGSICLWLLLSGDSALMACSTIPLFVMLSVFLSNPPAGRGVGKEGAALGSDLRFIRGNAKPKKRRAPAAPAAAPATTTGSAGAGKPAMAPLGEGGALLRGHAYVIVFFTMSHGSIQALPKIDKLAAHLAAAAREWFHVILITNATHNSSAEDIERWASGFRTPDLTPIAFDASGDAYARYMEENNVWVAPQAFVVDEEGLIAWHGQSNRTEMIRESSRILKEGLAKRATRADPGASASTEPKKDR